MDHQRTFALSAFRVLFRPVARSLLRAGITWPEIESVGKAAYVASAREESNGSDAAAEVASLAMLTGLGQPEVRRLLESDGPSEPYDLERMNAATRVLSGWWQDAEYADSGGGPMTLRAEGANPSFASLCVRYAAGVPAPEVLDALKRVGAVGESNVGELTATCRSYMPSPGDPEHVLRSGSVLQDIADTIAYNLSRGGGDPSRFERRATNINMSPRDVARFRTFLEDEGQAFLERIDAWLSENERKDSDTSSGLRLGLGAYWIEEPMKARAGK